jgi:hypothetical protein
MRTVGKKLGINEDRRFFIDRDLQQLCYVHIKLPRCGELLRWS